MLLEGASWNMTFPTVDDSQLPIARTLFYVDFKSLEDAGADAA